MTPWERRALGAAVWLLAIALVVQSVLIFLGWSMVPAVILLVAQAFIAPRAWVMLRENHPDRGTE